MNIKKLWRYAPTELMIAINDHPNVTGYRLSRIINVNDAWTYQLIRLFGEEGFVKRTDSKGERRIEVTDKGKKLAEYLLNIKELMRNG